ncbi:TPA: MnhB domain-containing protein [Pseudomonas aeruginosa]|uniref:MnhB domain-containing protein n=1 Tax=Pseudomonas aeruginosa TaxID=287 RepID=UPI0005B39C5D|nr:MnhB domain-containing protein [Pseudomonas aeruginosa]MBG3944242.1 Na(+)/H(+) antiporter subunit B [Pseudomonas aeruginosa]MBG5635405.1 Na(+)/H(+) antiporter subunit B [Pseudomonas aeruginosa]MBG6973609.1 Na(+)/H(+) antiporter subunit B [Pseudomonas aeruginosa]MBG7548727.1 Na(+)/H(+) antiporter subunit B [Pseudomonas aeruginosa]MCU9029193.1 Na(+)/H(+) antiporter subunit B [Pseudomonas aeruginosa]
MPSIVFSAMARVFFWVMLVTSILILLRGHNQPGGGFVGGLVAAMAIGVVALADGVPKARALLPLHPVTVIGLGVLFGLLGGLPGLLIEGSFLEHQWLLFDNGIKLGTTMIFDLGVYFVVLGGMLALIFRLYEDAP